MSKKNKQRQERREQERREHDHHMYITEVELMCQNQGKTFHKEVFQPHTRFRCWCQLEIFDILLGTGKGNVVVMCTNKFGTRQLDPVIPNERHHDDDKPGLIGYDETGGSFLIVKQILP